MKNETYGTIYRFGNYICIIVIYFFMTFQGCSKDQIYSDEKEALDKNVRWSELPLDLGITKDEYDSLMKGDYVGNEIDSYESIFMKR